MPSYPDSNPSRPLEWWKTAETMGLDPAHLDITAYEARSASKFTATDFLYLKAIWKNSNIDKFHVHDYVRKTHIETARELLGEASPGPPSEQKQSIDALRGNLITFIKTAGTSFRLGDPLNSQLGAFLNVKWYLERTKAIPAGEVLVGATTPKIIRMSERLRKKRQAGEAPLVRGMGSLSLQEQKPQRPTTPPRAPQTPPSQVLGSSPLGPVATNELAVISPDTLHLDKDRSEDEEIVNSTLVTLLITVTLCSGIGLVKGRESMVWLPKRQSFRLGSPSDPVCEARTDGILRSKGRILAILEVKPYGRDFNTVPLEWQEACQMAAWISTSLHQGTAEKRKEGIISTSDKVKSRRVLISQDYRFLYITIAEWGKGYEKYLHGGHRPVTPPSATNSPTRGRGRTDARPPSGTTTKTSGPGLNSARTQVHNRPNTPSRERDSISRAGSPAKEQVRAQSNTRTPSPLSRQLPSQPPKPPTATAATTKRLPTAEELDEGNFLTMRCFGPYSLSDHHHLHMFLRNLLALMLELSDPWE